MLNIFSAAVSKSDQAGSTKKKCFIAVALAVLLLASYLLANGGESANFLKRKQADQRFSEPLVTIMGSDALNKGYNLLRGRGAEPRVARALGQFSIHNKKLVEYDGTVYFQPDQVDMTMDSKCWSSQSQNEVFQSFSVSEARNVAAQSSFRLGVGLEANFRFFGAGANVGMQAALAFGKSMEMQNSASQRNAGYSYAVNSFVESTLFTMFVDWDTVQVENEAQFGFYDPFKKAVEALNQEKVGRLENIARVFEFIERFGTHVIREATFGAKCSLTTYLQAGSSAAQRSAFASSAYNYGLSMKAWASVKKFGGSVSGSIAIDHSSAYQEATYKSGTYEGGWKYSMDNIRCEGHVKDNLCNSEFSASSDDPDMIAYAPFPIWEIGIAGWEKTGIENFKEGLQALETPAESCKRTECNNHGFCVLSDEFWLKVSSGEFNGQIGTSDFDVTCVCEDGFQGEKCDQALPPDSTAKPVPDEMYTWENNPVGASCSQICNEVAAAEVVSTSSLDFANLGTQSVCAFSGYVGFQWLQEGDNQFKRACIGSQGTSIFRQYTYTCLCQRVGGAGTWTKADGKTCPTVCDEAAKSSAVESIQTTGGRGYVCRQLETGRTQSGWESAGLCFFENAGGAQRTANYECLCV